PDVTTSLNNLARSYHARGRDPEAEPLYKRCLAIREKALGRGGSRATGSGEAMAESRRRHRCGGEPAARPPRRRGRNRVAPTAGDEAQTLLARGRGDAGLSHRCRPELAVGGTPRPRRLPLARSRG